MWELGLMLLAGHYIGDFGLQTAWQAAEKGKAWHANLGHAGSYTAAVAVTAAIEGTILPWWAVVLILVSHFVIDALKARWNIIGVWTDQGLHFAVLAAVFAGIKLL